MLRTRQAQWSVAEIQDQQITRVRHRRVHELIYAAKVRNGFVPRLRREVWQKLKRLETPLCPFANLPEKKRTQFSLTREDMKNCIWLNHALVAQTSSPSGRLTGTQDIQGLVGCERTKSHMESLGSEAKQNGVRFRELEL
jgi:hypothetical protein